jgi:hypothetical protein
MGTIMAQSHDEITQVNTGAPLGRLPLPPPIWQWLCIVVIVGGVVAAWFL